MASFQDAVVKTLRWEGGFTVDTGGETRYGISKNAYPNVDIKNLTLDQAKEIYRRDYWNKIQGDSIAAQDSANALFDFAVNAGLSRAIRESRAALLSLGYPVNAEGGIDSKLISFINAAGRNFAAALGSRRIAFYSRLAAQNPAKYGKYLAGWLKRSKDFFKPALGGAAVLILAAGIGLFYYHRKTGRWWPKIED